MGVALCFDFAVLFGSDWVFGGVLGTGVFVVPDQKKKKNADIHDCAA